MAGVIPAVGAAMKGLFAAGGAAAASGGAATAATAAKTTLTLSKVMSAGSALAAIGQGIAARGQLKTQAAFAEAEAEQETAAGATRAMDLSKEYAQLRSEQEVIQAANGLDLGTGTPMNVGDATMKIADRNMDTTRKNAANRAASSRLRSRGLMAESRMATLGGMTKAAGIMMDSYQLTG